MITTSDIEEWSSVCYGDEIPLSEVADMLRNNPKACSLQPAESTNRSSLVLSTGDGNDEGETPLLITHAFIIRYATPLETGTFVPDGETLPKGITQYNRKTEPGLQVNISLSFDVSMDREFHSHIAALEEWAKSQPKIKGTGRPKSRTAWNNLADVAAQSKFTVTSRVFRPADGARRKRKAESKKTSALGYALHPWIKEATAARDAEWEPNPDRVQFFHKEGDIMIRIEDSANPSLRYGDLTKVLFKVMFTASTATWGMSFSPVQVMRVIDGEEYQGGGFGGPAVDDDTSSRVLKPGATLTPVVRGRERLNGDGEHPIDAELPRKREPRRSPSWEPLTPEPDDSGSQVIGGSPVPSETGSRDDDLSEELTVPNKRKRSTGEETGRKKRTVRFKVSREARLFAVK
ncbi:hypothetical protein NMY22_g1347 [Coprinellus aureogranulatus]|nr:hypothetical protein NMY22_g1347 [Coprinellus aureogranulatus]